MDQGRPVVLRLGTVVTALAAFSIEAPAQGFREVAERQAGLSWALSSAGGNLWDVGRGVGPGRLLFQP